MATKLPPMGKISMICIWIETVLYGVNCVMYGLCMFILLRGGKPTPLGWVLVVISTILFLLCTIHVAASLRQLLEAFVYVPADVPDYSTTYWLNNTNTMAVLKDHLYDTLVLVQYSVLIWRLYAVFMRDWRVVVLPIILAVGCIGTLYAIAALAMVPNTSLHGSVVSGLIESAWVLDMALNVSVTVAIAVRLRWMGRQIASSMTTQANRYASSVYVVVESGAILLVTNITILALYTSNSPVSFTILNVASQLAALTPFLIVVQVGLTGRYRIPRIPSGPSGGFSNMGLTAQNEIVSHTGASEEQDLRQDISLRTCTRSQSCASDVG